jgi:glycosyltransferase involved in cell wall biosynthesis
MTPSSPPCPPPPLVSVCIPSYNAAEFIGDTLRSVMAQTYNNLEIIICDDCSTDGTLAVVRQFNDPRITINANAQNLGSSGNYNKILSLARGKYVKLLCADDLLAPDCIEKQVRAFEEHPADNLALVTAGKWIINKKGRRLFKVMFSGRGVVDGRRTVIRSVLRGTNIIGEPGLPLMRTDILRQTTGVIEEKYFTYCNDFDLWCKILEHGNLFVINEPLFMFRIVNTSTTAGMGFRQARITGDYLTDVTRTPVFW